MPIRPIDMTILLALFAGVVLAIMTDWNSQLALHSSPLFASWIAHGVGAIVSLALVVLLPVKKQETLDGMNENRWPVWSYLGGIPGAFTVLFAAITVNSNLGLSGTLALLLVGQMAFGVLADYFGFFRLRRRRTKLREATGLAAVLVGGIIIILARK